MNAFAYNLGCLTCGIGSGNSKNHLYSGLSHCGGVVSLSFVDGDVVVNGLLLVTVSLSRSNIRKGPATVNVSSNKNDVRRLLDNIVIIKFRKGRTNLQIEEASGAVFVRGRRKVTHEIDRFEQRLPMMLSISVETWL